MATSFDTIYAKCENRSTDSSLSTQSYLYYYDMFHSLTYAISEFDEECNKDLTDRTDYSYTFYEFTGDGSTTEFVLTSPPSNANIYVKINDTTNTDFTYSLSTVTFNNPPVSGVTIYIYAYVIGQFTETLNDTEISILADGIKVNFVSKTLYKSGQLNQMVYGNSIGIHSQASHNKTLHIIDTDMYKRWKARITEYSYTHDDDDLENLVGDDSD